MNSSDTSYNRAAGQIRVLVVDGHELMRHGVRALLCRDPAITVVGEADDCDEAVRLATELNPDVVVLDVRLRTHDGVDVARVIKQASQARLVILTTYDDDQHLWSLARLGISSYLLKSAPAVDIARAVYEAAEGRLAFPPDVASKMTRLLQQVGDRAPRARLKERKWRAVHRMAEGLPGGKSVLTERESQVLQLVALGLRNREIANRMDIALKTVETHVERILLKTGARSRIEAALVAVHGRRFAGDGSGHVNAVAMGQEEKFHALVAGLRAPAQN